MNKYAIPVKINRSIAMLTEGTQQRYPGQHLVITIDRSANAYGSAYTRETAEEAEALAIEFNRRRKKYQGHNAYCICTVAPDGTVTDYYRYQPNR